MIVEEPYRDRVIKLLDLKLESGEKFTKFGREEIIDLKTDFLNRLDEYITENGSSPEEIITDQYIQEELFKLSVIDKFMVMGEGLRNYLGGAACVDCLVNTEQSSRALLDFLMSNDGEEEGEEEKPILEGEQLLKQLEKQIKEEGDDDAN